MNSTHSQRYIDIKMRVTIDTLISYIVSRNFLCEKWKYAQNNVD